MRRIVVEFSLRVAAVLLLGGAALAGACDKSDQTRSALEIHRTEWDKQISALSRRNSDLEARFRALPAPKGDDLVAAQAQRRRLQASIVGTKQTLADIQSHLTDSAQQVEAAIGQGPVEGEEALNGVIVRMNEYVRLQEQTVAVNEDALLHTGEVARHD